MCPSGVEGSELYCFKTEGDRNSVITEVSCRMDVTRLEQRTYIRIAILQGRNARKRHSELVETVGNNDLSYRTVTRWAATVQLF